MSTPSTKTTSPLAKRLIEEISVENVSETRPDRLNYARDLWPLDTISVRDGIVPPSPDVIAWPNNEYQVRQVLKVACEEKVPLIPYGAGSGVCGGTVPLHGGIILDLKKMSKIFSIDDKSLLAHVQTGIVGENFERKLNREGYTVGHFPSSMYCSTVGGWIAARGAGQLSSKYGKAEDRVLALKAVTGKGEVIETVRSPRSATGPDWIQAITGSEGTYAVVTEAWMKISPYPESREFHAFHFPNLTDAIDAVRAIFQAEIKPAACRLYDPVDTFIAGSGKSAVTEGPKRESILSKIIERLHHGSVDIPREILPRLVSRPSMLNKAIRKRATKSRLILTFEGPPEKAKMEHDRSVEICKRNRGDDLGPEPAQRWWSHRYAVSYGLSTMFDLGLFADTMEVATNWSNLENLYHRIMETIGKHAFVMAHFSHAYPQGCSIYFTFAAGAGDPVKRRNKYKRIWEEALRTAVNAGGVVSHHHGVGVLKGDYMQAEHGEAMKIVRALKRAFDPEGILNPGKMGL